MPPRPAHCHDALRAPPCGGPVSPAGSVAARSRSPATPRSRRLAGRRNRLRRGNARTLSAVPFHAARSRPRRAMRTAALREHPVYRRSRRSFETRAFDGPRGPAVESPGYPERGLRQGRSSGRLVRSSKGVGAGSPANPRRFRRHPVCRRAQERARPRFHGAFGCPELSIRVHRRHENPDAHIGHTELRPPRDQPRGRIA